MHKYGLHTPVIELKVGMIIVNITNPEWGEWRVSAGPGTQGGCGWEISKRYPRSGSRMLDIDEALKFWRLAK